MIFICLTIVDFPDSPEPVKRGVSVFMGERVKMDVKGRDGGLRPPVTLQADEREVVH